MKHVESLSKAADKKNDFKTTIEWLEDNGWLELEDAFDKLNDKDLSSYHRTKRTIEDIVTNNVVEGKSWFVTLTYDNDHQPNNIKDARYSLRKFFENLRVQNIDISYIAVHETKPRWHWHIIIFEGIERDYNELVKTNKGRNFKAARSNTLDKWKNGFYDMQLISYQDNEKLGGYLTKYILKENVGFGVRKYSTSNGLKRSKYHYDYLDIDLKDLEVIQEKSYSNRYMGQVFERKFKKPKKMTHEDAL